MEKLLEKITKVNKPYDKKIIEDNSKCPFCNQKAEVTDSYDGSTSYGCQCGAHWRVTITEDETAVDCSGHLEDILKIRHKALVMENLMEVLSEKYSSEDLYAMLERETSTRFAGEVIYQAELDEMGK